jgi:hypothetical protein
MARRRRPTRAEIALAKKRSEAALRGVETRRRNALAAARAAARALRKSKPAPKPKPVPKSAPKSKKPTKRELAERRSEAALRGAETRKQNALAAEKAARALAKKRRAAALKGAETRRLKAEAAAELLEKRREAARRGVETRRRKAEEAAAAQAELEERARAAAEVEAAALAERARLEAEAEAARLKEERAERARRGWESRRENQEREDAARGGPSLLFLSEWRSLGGSVEKIGPLEWEAMWSLPVDDEGVQEVWMQAEEQVRELIRRESGWCGGSFFVGDEELFDPERYRRTFGLATISTSSYLTENVATMFQTGEDILEDVTGAGLAAKGLAVRVYWGSERPDWKSREQ